MDIMITVLVVLAVVIWAVSKSGNTTINAREDGRLVCPIAKQKDP
jgi:hypothetical protein